MKKLFLIVGLVALIIAGGCSKDSAIQHRYHAEKLFHEAEAKLKKASIQAASQDSALRDEIKAGYLKTIAYCWQNLDSVPGEAYPNDRRELETIAFSSVERLSRFYFAEKKYDSAGLLIDQLLTLTQLDGTPLLRTRLNQAHVNMMQGKPVNTINIYHSLLIRFYPPVNNDNQIIMDVINLPLDVIAICRELQNDSLLTAEKISAKDYYERLIDEWPNSALATVAHGNLARLYADEKNYSAAITHLREVKDSIGGTDAEARLLIANLTAGGLKDYPSAMVIYDELITETTDTLIRPHILMQKAVALYDSKHYVECRATINLIRDEHESYFARNSAPQKYLALAFDKEGDWERAETEYLRLIDQYATSEDAFNAYLVVAEHYEKTGNDKLTDLWYNRANDFYTRMASTYAGTSVEPSAIAFTADVARRRGQWQQAADILVGLYERFPETEIGRKAIINAAGVYTQKLNNKSRGDSLLQILQNSLVGQQGDKNIGSNTDE
ncbi:MAG: tetratricopeptide repeat protein [candidate division Zixibacteria bacterium]|nr:tetratricopeptide repeat protein [candidate division Zixibacteria bacterium]